MKSSQILMMGQGNKSGYGYLYNWYTIDGNSTNLITDLHVPSDTEWDTLVTYLSSDQGGKLKETGLTHWDSPNTGAVNTYNFTAFGGGFRQSVDGTFVYFKEKGYWWNSDAYDSTNSYYYVIYNDSAIVGGTAIDKKHGFSIRCMRALTSTEQSTYADGDTVETKTDYDGNSYNVVRIGTQGWSVGNLKTTHYLDGTALTKVTDNTAWENLTTEGYCAYDNSESNV